MENIKESNKIESIIIRKEENADEQEEMITPIPKIDEPKDTKNK